MSVDQLPDDTPVSRYGPQPSWRSVAGLLAARLARFAACPVHDDPDGDPERCEHCADQLAYRVWREKVQAEFAGQREAPELWTSTEAAAALGLTRTRIHQLAEAYPEELPPVMRGKRLKVWLAADWRAFARKERPPGVSRTDAP